MVKIKKEIKDNLINLASLRIQSGSLEEFKNLIKTYPNIIKYRHSKNKASLLDIAIQRKEEEFIFYLIQIGTPITSQTIHTALIEDFLIKNDYSITEFLLQKVSVKILKESILLLEKSKNIINKYDTYNTTKELDGAIKKVNEYINLYEEKKVLDDTISSKNNIKKTQKI